MATKLLVETLTVKCNGELIGVATVIGDQAVGRDTDCKV